MSKPRTITANDIIRGAMQSRKPKVRFPGLSFDLQRQARSMIAEHEGTHTRRAASPFVRSILGKKWRSS